MRSEASTVADYLDELPEDRRAAIAAVRQVVLDNLPEGYEETMHWGMIAYEVPLSVCPHTYNGQPLMYAALASQKRHMAVYLTNVYADAHLMGCLEAGFEAAGRQLDMGASCVRFRKLGDVPLDVIGAMIAATPIDEFIAASHH